MTQYLPPNLLALFAPRDPIPYLPPVDKLTWEKKTDGYTGIAHLLQRFEDPKDTPPPTRVETRDERLERKRREKAEQMQYKLEQEIAIWDPTNNESGTSDPYKTLFVSRVNYDSSESKLRREFEIYGPIKKIVMTHNLKTGKPRGYAFIEYEHERDMHSAYKHADGKKIDNRRVLVDVERARTVKGWLPRRLGGGLGGTRRGGPDVNIKHSGREDDRKKGGRDEEGGRFAGRERGDREDRSRSNRRERSRSREREREPRRRRSRSRERKRRRSRSRDREAAAGNPEEAVEGAEAAAAAKGEAVKERRRRRSRSRERKRRSRSRDRKHRRDRDRDRKERPAGEDGDQPLKIKQEPEDDYPDYSGQSYYNNFPLKDEDERAKNGTEQGLPEDQQPKYEDGEEGHGGGGGGGGGGGEEQQQQQTNEIDY